VPLLVDGGVQLKVALLLLFKTPDSCVDEVRFIPETSKSAERLLPPSSTTAVNRLYLFIYSSSLL
jgi:hypothetical protein